MCEAEKYSSQKIVKILIGNKSDKEATREVSKEEAMRFAASMGMEYIETSAKTTSNVEKAFITLTENMKSLFIKEGPKSQKPKQPFQLTPTSPEKNCWQAFNEMFIKMAKFIGLK